MQVKKTFRSLFGAAVLSCLAAGAAAQTSSINAFSPYTMYGIGELSTPDAFDAFDGRRGGRRAQSGVANMLNPAAFSAAPRKTFLFSFGIEGQNYYNSQSVDNTSKKSAYNTFNFHDIAFQIPIAKKVGLGFSLAPYSSVGYRTQYYREYRPNDPVWGNIGPMQYTYQGEGDLSEVKLGSAGSRSRIFPSASPPSIIGAESTVPTSPFPPP